MSTEKIHRAAPLGSRREDVQLFGLLPAAPGLVFLPVLPGGVPAAAPVPSYQQPDPEQLFPVSTPAALLPAIHPGGSDSQLPAPNNCSCYYPDSLRPR